jgi:hypothetical protein
MPKEAKAKSWRAKCPDLFPDVISQGGRGVCAYCATISSAQWELNREMYLNQVAAKSGTRKIKLVWESLVKRLLELHGLQPGAATAADLRKHEDDLIEKGGSIYDLADAAVWCFKHLGAESIWYNEENAPANGDSEEEPVPAGRFNVLLHDYTRYEVLSAAQTKAFLSEGKSVQATVLVGRDFRNLQADEIYGWWPKVDRETDKWVEEPGRHAIVLFGTGDAGPELEHLQFHPFLNSHGPQYANGGMGCVFHMSLSEPFYILEMKAPPKVVIKSTSELLASAGSRPRLSQSLAKPSLPPNGRSPSPPQGRLQSDQRPGATPHYRTPAQRRVRWPTPPRGRASIDAERWR